ncbi:MULTISPECIES: hypothetical protein [Aneurinibacillus]|uniref:hypothetical protein n=1 Tax=Aneurinibacillus TaxID=55079 RepID=UPI0007093F08|nr:MULTISPECIES: hypothetical protein [Aneurinibacillus]AMA71597.1 hypothetical protein ACH33_01260 [Aneurinibacillus sp. XH2]MED0677656.1 hypothetical protein [Aneurinibacillus thermoaerophilus]MED0678575.1 hypothetical protein [Aneurinibacillus thermoaerophilus]MED0735723.1 hypothetical protein [Aneurinibacillus thermoaerophilus]MED0757576.1 hypothetical protein [Aneurinibacillus thermoaerophilus]
MTIIGRTSKNKWTEHLSITKIKDEHMIEGIYMLGGSKGMGTKKPNIQRIHSVFEKNISKQVKIKTKDNHKSTKDIFKKWMMDMFI